MTKISAIFPGKLIGIIKLTAMFPGNLLKLFFTFSPNIQCKLLFVLPGILVSITSSTQLLVYSLSKVLY